MANHRHLTIFKQGAEIWNRWREQHKGISPDLSRSEITVLDQGKTDFREANLYGADLRDVEFVGINLQGADLRESDLRGAYLWEINLEASNLSEAFLGDTNFNYVNLQKASLIKLSLLNTHLFRVDLTGADFSHCLMGGTLLADIDLSVARALETVDHRGPSIIGIDTIYRSGGKIPEIFLRGAGVQESFISNMKAIVGAMSPLEFYSCFISYSIRDREFAERLHADLQTAGVRCWYFPEDAQWGQPAWGEIDRSIKAHDKLVVICSADALQSGPVNREIERALQREDRDHRHILFPIRLDEYIFENWQHPRKADVQSKVIGDFRDWKNHDSYKKSLARLLCDLKVNDKAESAVQGS